MSEATNDTAETGVATSGEAQQVDSGTPAPQIPKQGFVGRHSGAIMVFLGIIAAGGASFGANTWFAQNHTTHLAATGGPRLAKVVVINADTIMSKVIQSETGALTPRESARIGEVVGGTIHAEALKYAQAGDLVISSGVLAVPPRNNLTRQVETKVMQQVQAIENNGQAN